MKTVSYKISRLAFSFLFVALLVMGNGVAPANASSCTGLAKSACESAKACVWLDRYTTKSGVDVRAHCRNKNLKKSSLVNRLLGGTKSKTTIKKISTKKKASITKNSKPATKLK
nr:hypothetical protein [uncultured Cohaesibacter sp.]